MSIIRRARTTAPFTTILNAVVEDCSLSAEALGLLVYLVGKPDNWQVMPTQLKNRFGCGRDRIYRIMKELITAGYMQRDQSRADDGEFGTGNYLVSDEKLPLTEKQEAGSSDYPRPENKALQKKKTKNEISDSMYSEEFEDLWKQYPRTRNTSKKKAHDIWRMLNTDNRARVAAAIPIFAAAMRAEGRPEDKIKHFQFFLSERIYETVSAPAGAAVGVASKDWYKTLTRDQWQKVLDVWAMTNNWGISHGPEPGRPGCLVPPDLVAAHNIKHRGFMFSPEELEAFRSQVRVAENIGQAAE